MAETAATTNIVETKPVPERDQPGLSELREAVANAPEVAVTDAGKGNVFAIDGRHHHERGGPGGRFDMDGPVFAYEVTPVLGQSTRRAAEDARAWLLSAARGGTDPAK